jgi:hypothetical protein
MPLCAWFLERGLHIWIRCHITPRFREVAKQLADEADYAVNTHRGPEDVLCRLRAEGPIIRVAELLRSFPSWQMSMVCDLFRKMAFSDQTRTLQSLKHIHEKQGDVVHEDDTSEDEQSGSAAATASAAAPKQGDVVHEDDTSGDEQSGSAAATASAAAP